jgi:hypothetical protein
MILNELKSRPIWMSNVKEKLATRIGRVPCCRDVNIRAVTLAMCA